jgi:hypothetical protein
MKKTFSSMGMVAATVLLLAACVSRLHPVMNFEASDVPAGLSQAKVQEVITSSARALKWKAKTVRPGLVVAKINVRGHVAEVSIPYSNKNYSIFYKSSKNLDYNGHDIHRNYNRWVANLNKKIQDRLQGITDD